VIWSEKRAMTIMTLVASPSTSCAAQRLDIQDQRPSTWSKKKAMNLVTVPIRIQTMSLRFEFGRRAQRESLMFQAVL